MSRTCSVKHAGWLSNPQCTLIATMRIILTRSPPSDETKNPQLRELDQMLPFSWEEEQNIAFTSVSSFFLIAFLRDEHSWKEAQPYFIVYLSIIYSTYISCFGGPRSNLLGRCSLSYVYLSCFSVHCPCLFFPSLLLAII